MRRGPVVLLALVALAGAPGAHAASWAQPQIRIVVANGLMGPSVENFRPQSALTRAALGQIVANLTGEPQVVVDLVYGSAETELVRVARERGATAVEYALMVALIAVVIILAVTFLGQSARDKFQEVGDAVAST